MRRRILAFGFLSLLSTALVAAEPRRVAVRIEPAQEVKAIVVRSGDVTQAVSVAGGAIVVPADVPFPWQLGMSRFEANPYTREDFDNKRPWVIRELGVLQGRIERPSPKPGDPFVWLLQDIDSDPVLEREVALDANGAFRLVLPAGTYHGAAVGPSSATRIRSAIVVKPGQTTDIGVLASSATAPVSVRVVDARTRKPVAGARVVWDPPAEILNSPVIRTLYGRRWSGMSDRRGIVEFPAIGPVPHTVRWRVESREYAPAQTARLRLKESQRLVLPDVALRQEPAVIVRVQFPRRDEEGLANCTLVSGEIRDPHDPKYQPVERRELREGETRFAFRSYGKKRLSIEDKRRATLFYHDFEVTEEETIVDLPLRSIEVHGRVTQRDKALSGELVRLADPHDAKVMLAQVTSDEDGAYRLSTWQRGKLFLYTISRAYRDGKTPGTASATVDVGDGSEVRIDLEVPAEGFIVKVVDANTGAPVEAGVRIRARFDDNNGVYSFNRTDAKGVLEVSGYKRGTANLHVEAKGYRAADVDIAIRPELPEATVRLQPAKAVSGRVVNVQGQPIAGARVTGGFADEHEAFGYHEATTDRNGRFEFSTPPNASTPIYVFAAGYALTITSLRSEEPAPIVLHHLSAAGLSLREADQVPEKVYLTMAAPAGQELIPLGVLEQVAALNGMDLYQLCGSSFDGDVVLPQFLGPGTYDVFIARRGGNPFTYQRLGAVTTPLPRNRVFPLPGGN